MATLQNCIVKSPSTNLNNSTLPRNGIPNGGVIWSGTTQAGHVANTNALQDYEVKLDVGISTLRNASTIELIFNTGEVVVGLVTHRVYRNTNVTGVAFVIESWMTSVRNATVNVEGIINRTNINYNLNNNNIGEPFSFTEVEDLNGTMTGQFNNAVMDFRGSSTRIVAFFSRRIMDHPSFGGTLGDVNPSWGATGLQEVSEIPDRAIGSSTWGGEIHAGIPLVFSTSSNLSNFIRDMQMSGVFTNGTTSLDQILVENSENRIEVSTDEGVMYIPPANPDVTPDENTQVSLYGVDDIISVYHVPINFTNINAFADNTASIVSIETFNFGSFANSNFNKLNNFPYKYWEIRTAEGGSLPITRNDYLQGDNQTLFCQFEFRGGDSPCLYLSVAGGMLLVEQYSTMPIQLDATGSIRKQLTTNQSHQINVESTRQNAGWGLLLMGAVATVGLAAVTGGASLAVKAGVSALGVAGVNNMIGNRRAEHNIASQNTGSSIGALSAPNRVFSGGAGFNIGRANFTVFEKGASENAISSLEGIFSVYGEVVQAYGNLGNRLDKDGVSHASGTNLGKFYQFSTVNVQGATAVHANNIEQYFLNGVFLL